MSDYAGDLAPQQAWDLLASDPSAVLVDVRTSAEWQWVGGADLSELGRRAVGIEWMTSAGEPNHRFLEQLAAYVNTFGGGPAIPRGVRYRCPTCRAGTPSANQMLA